MNILKRTLAGLLVVYLAFGQVTVIPGDWVQGFSSLTAAGSNVYVTGIGTIGQDTSFTRSAAGRYTLYNATPTTGVTTLTVQAGAGQSTTKLVDLVDSGGTVSQAYFLGDASFYQEFGFVRKLALSRNTGLQLSSDRSLQFFSATGLASGSADLALARASANNLAITNGSSTNYALIGADGIILNNGRFQIPTSTPASASATCTAGTIAWGTNFTYVCVAKDTWKRAAIATW